MTGNKPVVRTWKPQIGSRIHSQRLENALVHERFKAHAGNMFNHSFQMEETLTGIVEPRTRLERRYKLLVIHPSPVGEPCGVAQNVARRNPVTPVAC